MESIAESFCCWWRVAATGVETPELAPDYDMA
jgi:hypothetical protein